MTMKATERPGEPDSADVDLDGELIPMGGLEVVDRASSEARLPLILGAVVVYKGAARNRRVAFPGRIYVSAIELEGGKQHITKEASNEGIQAYDFATHDLAGRIIKSRLFPNAPRTMPELKNKPFSPCEHPEHLRRFMRAKNAAGEMEYEVLLPASSRNTFERFKQQREYLQGLRERELEETTSR